MVILASLPLKKQAKEKTMNEFYSLQKKVGPYGLYEVAASSDLSTLLSIAKPGEIIFQEKPVFRIVPS